MDAAAVIVVPSARPGVELLSSRGYAVVSAERPLA
jgi:hypothetical protein